MAEAKPFGMRLCMSTVEHREPCESRDSRTVLGAPGGEIPPGDSTTLETFPTLPKMSLVGA